MENASSDTIRSLSVLGLKYGGEILCLVWNRVQVWKVLKHTSSQILESSPSPVLGKASLIMQCLNGFDLKINIMINMPRLSKSNCTPLIPDNKDLLIKFRSQCHPPPPPPPPQPPTPYTHNQKERNYTVVGQPKHNETCHGCHVFNLPS